MLLCRDKRKKKYNEVPDIQVGVKKRIKVQEDARERATKHTNEGAKKAEIPQSRQIHPCNTIDRSRPDNPAV